MEHRFHRHYTPDEARALLPEIRIWLGHLKSERTKAIELESKLGRLSAEGRDLGGAEVHGWIKSLCQIKRMMEEFQRREIQIKDVDRGLIDFPAIVGGREVFLCWEEGEEDIEFWHDLDSGYAGREPL